MLSDKQRFSNLIDDMALVYGREVTPALKRIYWDDLGTLPIDIIEAAASAHRKDSDRGRFFPKVADIVYQVERASPGDGRADADEAWSICLSSFDEADSVCINAEILQARSVAMPVYQSGDEVGARMAFKAAYNRITDEARRTNQPAGWFLSIGFDPSLREPARLKGETAGRLPKPPDGPRLLLDGTYSDEVAADDDWTGKRLSKNQSGQLTHISALIEK